MTFLLEKIAELTAAHTIGLVPTPIAPFGYGRDLSCVTDLTEDMREIDQNSPAAIIESCFRFCTTPRESIPDAPGRGFDVSTLLNKGITPQDLLEAEGDIRGEVEQDDRIERSRVTVSLSNTAEPRLRIEFRIWPYDPRTGEFSFCFAATGPGAVFVESLK